MRTALATDSLLGSSAPCAKAWRTSAGFASERLGATRWGSTRRTLGVLSGSAPAFATPGLAAALAGVLRVVIGGDVLKHWRPTERMCGQKTRHDGALNATGVESVVGPVSGDGQIVIGH